MTTIMEAGSVLEALRTLYRPPTRAKQVSLSIYARKLGYKSPRLMEMVIRGDRAPSADFLSRTGDLFSLSDTERNFLELLAQKEKLRSSGRSIELLERRIRGLKEKVVSARFVEPQIFALFSDWHCLVVKQLLRSSLEGLTIRDLTKRLWGNVTEAEVKKAVHALLHLGIVERGTAAGTFVGVKKEPIYTLPDFPSESVRKHHRQMMERAIEALETQNLTEREMISMTFACPTAALPRLKETLRRFRDEVNLEFSEPTSSVFQLNLQLFLQTR